MKTWSLILAAVETHGTAVMVSVVSTAGSVPRETGAHFIVTPDGFHGTIGGGTLEWQALAKAQAMLKTPANTKLSSHALGPELGQCCGGRMQLATEVFDHGSLEMLRSLAEQEIAGPFLIAKRNPNLAITERFGEVRRRLYLYGAGHVGRALVMALAPLPFDVHWIDNRPNAFPRFAPENVTCLAPANPLTPIAGAPESSMVWIMSHSHALDLAIADAALRNVAVAHVGLIGSATKRARFENRLHEAGVTAARVTSLICPIGVEGIQSKEPAAIALAAAAQLQVLHEKLGAVAVPEVPAVALGKAYGAMR